MTINKLKFSPGDKVILAYPECEAHRAIEDFIGYVEQAFDGECVIYKDDPEEGFWVKNSEIELLQKASVVKADGSKVLKPDAVNHPKHYAVFEQLEAIEVIASSMTTDQFYGYCLGNILKYRLRAGGKDDVMQELGKADKYQELFTTHKHLCKDAA